jgi:DNA repair photolyase
MPHDFSDVAVKENAAELLDDALSRKRRKCMIGFGSMSDPYIPAEKELGLTRRCLEIISRRGFGVSLITKSDLVLRDLDLLK